MDENTDVRWSLTDLAKPFTALLDQQKSLSKNWDSFTALSDNHLATMRSMNEQMLGYARQMNDQFDAQNHVGLRLAKESMDFGVNMMGTMSRILFDSAEAAQKTAPWRR